MKVLVIGDAILDHYVYGRINRQSPEDESVPILDVKKEEYRLGGCMNVAANIRSIARPDWRIKKNPDRPFEVHLSSVFSGFTGAQLNKKSINCDDSCMVDERRAGDLEPCSRELIKTRVINLDTNKQMIRIDNRLKYEPNDIELYKEVFGRIDPSFDAVVISDYAKGLVNGHTLERLKDYDGWIFIDSKNPDLKFWEPLQPGKVFIKMNEHEWQNSKNTTKHQCIVTQGKKGATTPCPAGALQETIDFPTEPIESPDVVGAGDVFLAGFVVKFLRTEDLDESIKFANMVAGKSVKLQGTAEVYLW